MQHFYLFTHTHLFSEPKIIFTQGQMRSVGNHYKFEGKHNFLLHIANNMFYHLPPRIPEIDLAMSDIRYGGIPVLLDFSWVNISHHGSEILCMHSAHSCRQPHVDRRHEKGQSELEGQSPINKRDHQTPFLPTLRSSLSTVPIRAKSLFSLLERQHTFWSHVHDFSSQFVKIPNCHSWLGRAGGMALQRTPDTCFLCISGHLTCKHTREEVHGTRCRLKIEWIGRTPSSTSHQTHHTFRPAATDHG